MSKAWKTIGSVFYVYALLDPRKPGYYKYGNFRFHFEPFYIGKGCKGRVNNHRSISAESEISKGSTFKAKLSRKILRSGFGSIPHRVIKSGLDEESAFKMESRLIRLIGRRNKGLGPLANLTDGGDGGEAGRVVSTKTKAKLSKIVTRHFAELSEEEKLEHGKRSAQIHKERLKLRPEVECLRCAKISATLRSRSTKANSAVNEKKFRTAFANGWVPETIRSPLLKKLAAEVGLVYQ